MNRSNVVASARLLALVVVASGAACSDADTAPPVATVSFSANKTKLPLGSPIELTYRFEVAPDAKIDGDYRVFVHFKDSTDRQFWDDDHMPVTPTSQWRPGQTIQYTRTRFIPAVPYVGEARVEIGLYRDNPEGRLPLLGPDPADREGADRSYRVGTLELQPVGENIFIVDKSGWHPTEYAPDNTTLEWKWTQKNAVMTFRNPRRDVLLYIEYDSRTDVFSGKPQEVTVHVNEQPVAKFTAGSSAISLQKIPLNQAQLGTTDMVELRFEVDQTFTPAKLPGGGRDARELGFRVYHVFLEPR
jgi:hypothetical protein